jgi:hypothetical protein
VRNFEQAELIVHRGRKEHKTSSRPTLHGLSQPLNYPYFLVLACIYINLYDPRSNIAFVPLSLCKRRPTHQLAIHLPPLQYFNIYTTITTMASKFTEILEPGFQSTSPKSDVRLEDIIGAADLSQRARTSSEASSRSTSSSNGDRIGEKSRKRLSKLLTGAKR